MAEKGPRDVNSRKKGQFFCCFFLLVGLLFLFYVMCQAISIPISKYANRFSFIQVILFSSHSEQCLLFDDNLVLLFMIVWD